MGECHRQAMYWSMAEDGNVSCELCPHRCRIAENKAGQCGVRENCGGGLIAAGYGIISSIALDPIEKKPLYMFCPGKQILSIGGFGCNLSCPFCQNFEISIEATNSAFGVRDSEYSRVGRLKNAKGQELSPEDIAELAVQAVPAGNIGVAYTYNEPLIGYEFLYDCAGHVRDAGLYNVIVTNGYINAEPLKDLLPFVDAMNVDLKGFSDRFYNMVGGTQKEVTQTIETVVNYCHIEVTTLVIPGENEDDIEALAKWLSMIDPDIPLHLSRFFPRYKFSDREPTQRETILRLRDTAKEYLNNVFAGNM